MLPSRIGPYKIVRELGRGGMGVVYEGLHESIERRVALKVLRAEYVASAQILTSFFNELSEANLRRKSLILNT